MSREPPHLDQRTLDGLRELLGPASQGAIQRLVGAFREQKHRLFAERREAGEAQDPLALARTAHVLKGACRQLGIARAASYAENAESAARGGELDRALDALDRLERELDLVDPMLDSL